MLTSEQIQELIGQMTPEEKAAELTQLRREDSDTVLMGIKHGYHEDPVLADNAGSWLGFDGAEKVILAQKQHMEHNVHHIPLLFMTDVIHGYKTIFPSVLGLGCSWNPDLAENCARISALEASVSGVHVTFSPMADLVRDARWGRVIESTGEDPYLNSLYSAAFTRGYQQKDLRQYGTLAACAKHFAGYGAAEGGRDYDSTQIGLYELFNQYLPPFEAAIREGCRMIMPGFHTLNGMPCTCNSQLLQDILRTQIGFQGTIISDCTAVIELLRHGVCETPAQAAEMAIHAGIDIEMVSSTFFDSLRSRENSPSQDEKLRELQEAIDASVRRVLELKNELGLFDHPFRFADPDLEKELHLCAAHRQAARKAVQETCVLLKNDHELLPLSPKTRCALVGPFADRRSLIDIWGRINGEEKDCVTLKEGLSSILCGCAEGCILHNFRSQETDPYSPENQQLDAALLQEALQVCEDADIIIAAVGEHPDMSSEAGSRSSLELPDNQLQLLRTLNKTGKPVAALVFAGRPLVLTEVSSLCDAVLYCWFPGTEGGNGICDLLSGKAEPTGRLCISMPRSSSQMPLYYNHLPTGRPCNAERYLPFTSAYIDLPTGPLYPFGYGLGYTSFSIEKPIISKKKIIIAPKQSPADEDETLTVVSVNVLNTGSRPGTQTIQFYLSDPVGTYSRPVRMLKHFARVYLEPEQAETVSFEVHASDLAYMIPGKGRVLEPGLFRIYTGFDSSCKDCAEFTIE